MHRYVTSPSAAPYAASALYTPAPYAPYTPAMAKQPAKDNAQVRDVPVGRALRRLRALHARAIRAIHARHGQAARQGQCTGT
ncbi:hypothetical protein HW555_009614 [Spodoptera exigua]|uniref:Uncharacterized protein n=1 Tax=Spodoptera exigua TaxID=7107 RepID=A0A835L1P1_SPOEX|nr:hypothetical protein HW555_009613 [Spodoptera exigua]KAF9411650.1 hypothetical protein HW555_009614 [Spodoptera exigua]